MRLIGSSLPGPRSADIPEPDERGYRVLFMRYERIGDMIMATSIIRVIAQASPLGVVDVLATPATAPVLENNPHVGKVLTLDRKSWTSYLGIMRRLRREKYEVMVDGRINNPPIFTSTPLLMLAGGARYRVGSGGGRNATIYNVCVPEYNRSTHYIDGSKALAIPFGVNPEKLDWQPELFLTEAEQGSAEAKWSRARDSDAASGAGPRKRLLVNLSASEPKRRWPDGKFIAALSEAHREWPDLVIIVIGLPSEWNSVEAVAQQIGATPEATPSLRDAFALVGTADLVFTPDTSISHAASAFRKPSLVMLKYEHRPYAPYNTPGEIVAWTESEIKQLPHETVTNALRRLISKYGV